jgi:mercuric ion binding protein
MKHHLAATTVGVLLLAPFSAWAGDQTVALAVHHADCALCAPIVKGTLERVKGVKSVSVSQPNEMADVTARVTFDDRVANVPGLVAATTSAGYPAELAH